MYTNLRKNKRNAGIKYTKNFTDKNQNHDYLVTGLQTHGSLRSILLNVVHSF